jgi:HAD superfamily hydrolase (TIGR01509 family)
VTSACGVVFDLDGVLIDSEHLWEESWRAYCESAGGHWTHEDTLAVQGMSTPEWSSRIAEHLGRPAAHAEVADYCVSFTIRRIIEDGEGPLLPGARDLVTEVSDAVPIALASSAARRVIAAVLEHHGIAHLFSAVVSSEEVPRGKPSPDVYLEAVRQLGLAGERCLAVEDSANGIRAAHAAELFVIAIPNPKYPPKAEATRLAGHVAADHADAAAFIRKRLGKGGTR